MPGLVEEKVAESKRNGIAQTATGPQAPIEARAYVREGARLHVEPGDSAVPALRLRIAFSRAVAWIWAWSKAHGAALLKCKPYTDRPASIRDQVQYTLAGGWVAGEREWWKEAPGYLYGFVVAIPVTILGNTTMWIIQRPLRVLAVALIITLFMVGI